MAPLKEKAGGAAPPNREVEKTLGAPPELRDPNAELLRFWSKLKLMPAGIGEGATAELSTGSLSLLKENSGAVAVEPAVPEEEGGGGGAARFSSDPPASLRLSELPSATATAAPVTAPLPPLPPYFLSMLDRCFS